MGRSPHGNDIEPNTVLQETSSLVIATIECFRTTCVTGPQPDSEDQPLDRRQEDDIGNRIEDDDRPRPPTIYSRREPRRLRRA